MQAGDDFGIAEGWWGVDGTWHTTTAGTRAALRRSMGADEHPDGPPESPALWFVRPGDDTSIWSPGLLTFEDGTTLEVQGSLPAELPPGSHELISDGGHLTRVLSLPSRCRRAERSWGWTLQLPQTRSLRSWGHGDFADLATLARWARGHGAQVLAHNPLGAPIPSTTQQPSPYYSSSRRFWSPLYLRVEQVPGAELLGAELERATAAGCALDSSASIDRDAVWALKSAALRSIWALVRDSSRVGALLSAAQDDDVLMEHARFCALAERFGGGRSSFPPEAAHPAVLAGSAGAALRASIADDVERWRWIQLVADGQLADASRCGAALMSDLAVGFDPDGSDAWIDQDLLATGCRVGAPPDDLGPLGQDWGVPPYIPWRLRSVGYRPWIDVLRRVLRHAGLLRIDHVMGLFRLFCIPPGMDAVDGTYVYSHASELLDVACMEAARAGAVLVGEDLGTVEPDVRDAMRRRGVYGYRVGWFAEEPPEDWPPDTVAMMSTHDLPTIAGLWSGTDAADRGAAGLPATPEADARLRARLVALAEQGGLDRRRADDGGRTDDGGRADDGDAARITADAYRALAASGSDLVLATLEDAVGQRSRPNLPGTLDEHPNWRLPLPALVDDLGGAGADRIAEIMADRTPPR